MNSSADGIGKPPKKTTRDTWSEEFREFRLSRGHYPGITKRLGQLRYNDGSIARNAISDRRNDCLSRSTILTPTAQNVVFSCALRRISLTRPHHVS